MYALALYRMTNTKIKTRYNKDFTAITIPEPKSYAMPMPIPPHVGVGTEEDSLGSTEIVY